MASEGTTRVRLVICPNCRKVLPELSELSVYMCGGCGSVLQAKYRKNGKSVRSVSRGQSMQKNQLEHDSEDVKSTSSGQIENHCDTKECSSNPNRKEQIESPNCNIKPSGSWHFLNGLSSGYSECSDLMNGKEQAESMDCSIDPSGRWKFLSRVSSGDSLDLDNGKEQIESIDSKIKRSVSRSFSKEIESDDFSYHEREEKSSEAGWNTDVDENDESQSPHGKLSSRGKSSSFTTQRQSDENNPMKMSFASSNKQWQKSYGISYYESDHDQTRSIETVEASGTTDNWNISEELSSTTRGISKSPTARGSYDGDGSVSSCDGWDDEVPEQPPNLPNRSSFEYQVVADFASDRERPRREDMLMNKKTDYNPEVQHQLRKFLSMRSGEKHGLAVMDGLKWERSRNQARGQVGSPDSDDFDPINNRMRLVRDKSWSGDLIQRDFPTVYENGSPSNYAHNEFLRRTSEYSSSKVDYNEQMALLSKLDELRDQLSRSYNHREMANGRSPARGTQQPPPYYGYGQLDPKVPHYYDANYHKHPHVPLRTGNGGFQKGEFSQMHFSGQGTNGRNHVDYSSDLCFPEDWQGQIQIPSSSPSCNKVPCSGPSGHLCCEPYSSSSATQQKYMASCFTVGYCKMHSHDHGHMVHDVQKKYYQDRHQPVKQHCRPIAGGAPFIICYSCCELLQLPEDFISQKRVHRLRCSSCSRVLKFSLQNRTHIIPYYPNKMEPLYHGSDSEAVSHSTEGDSPFPVLQGNANDKKQPSSSYSEAKLERKNKSVLKTPRNNGKTSIEASESVGASSNMAILKSTTMSPRLFGSRPRLHRLLGYSSLSKIIKRDSSVKL
ncbi:hypothetical protein NE237_004774 [Protea cynaroides]|uniref:Zinc-ribbon domain-containing protein n=1 Tax=Protea cynaroides TaxID=273540 RepID=A0A9Q0KJL4_9MAGN|nr:hypothetical protein NE237_004774 [Protea cynaroides]